MMQPLLFLKNFNNTVKPEELLTLLAHLTIQQLMVLQKDCIKHSRKILKYLHDHQVQHLMNLLCKTYVHLFIVVIH